MGRRIQEGREGCQVRDREGDFWNRVAGAEGEGDVVVLIKTECSSERGSSTLSTVKSVGRVAHCW